MSRDKNCSETNVVSQLSRNCPHRGGIFEREKKSPLFQRFRKGVGGMGLATNKPPKRAQKVLQKCVPIFLRGHRKNVQKRGVNPWSLKGFFALVFEGFLRANPLFLPTPFSKLLTLVGERQFGRLFRRQFGRGKLRVKNCHETVGRQFFNAHSSTPTPVAGGHSDHGPRKTRTKTQTTPDSVFTRERRNSDHGLSFWGDHGLRLGCFWGRGRRGGSQFLP